jgi:hypothetical protein
MIHRVDRKHRPPRFDEEGAEDDATGSPEAGVMLTRDMDQRFAAIAGAWTLVRQPATLRWASPRRERRR